MSKPHKYLSLTGASQTRLLHAKDTRLPQVETMRNFVPAIDGCPALRDDLDYETERVMSCINAGAGGLAASDSSDYLNAIIEARNGQIAWFSRFFAFQTSSGTATIKNATYTTGTVSGTEETTSLTGSGTAWLQNAWPGCLMVINGNTVVHRVATVTDDTTIVLDQALPTGFSPSTATYTLYQVHNGVDAKYPLNIQQWGDRLVYNAESPEPPVVEASVSGPFTNDIIQGASFGQPTTLKVCLGYNFTAPFVVGPTTMVTGGYSAPVYGPFDGGAWTNSTGVWGGFVQCGVYDSGGKFTIISETVSQLGGNVYQDADGTGATWTAQYEPGTTELSKRVGMTEDGAGRYVVIRSRAISSSTGYYTDDLTAGFTGVDVLVNYALCIYHDGTNYIIGAESGGISTSADGETWALRTSTTNADIHFITSDGAGNIVAVGSDNTILLSTDNGVTWDTQTSALGDADVTWQTVRWSGTYFLVGGNVSGGGARAMTSTDGVTWTRVDLGTLETSSYEIYDAVPEDAAITGITVKMVWGGNQFRIAHLAQTTVSSTTFNDFHPLSIEYRAKAFTVAGTYLMLGCMREWNSTSSAWVYYPRRVRWPSPGTTTDFEGEGAGWLDLPGEGEILVLRTSGYNVVGFDTSGVFALEQLGDLDSPWGYRRLRNGIHIVSNVISVGTQLFFVAHDGRIWTTNGVQLEPWGKFDLTEFDDWIMAELKPVHIEWYPVWNALCVFRQTNTGTDHRVWVITEDERVSYITLPVWTDTGPNPDVTRRPMSLLVSKESAHRLYIGYDANTAVDTNHLVSLFLKKGSVIRGRDSVTSTITSRWYAQLQTGYERLTDEGDMVNVSTVELYGYAGYTGRTFSSSTTSKGPYVGTQMKTQDESSWWSPGTTAGTITVTTAACSGSSTALSNCIAAGNDVTKTFDLPCLARLARVFRKTGSTYTLQALTTNYTITGTKQITLVAALETGTDLYVYWDAEPLVKVEAGDLLITSPTGGDQVHRILTIPTATSATLDPYLSTGTSDTTGVHVPAERMDDGEGSTVHGMGHRGDDIQLRFTLIPQNDSAAPSSVRLTAINIEYQPLEAQEKRKD